MTIYDINQAILDCIDEEGEIIDVEAFHALQMERGDKIDNLACWVKQLFAEAAAIKTERDALTERAEQAKNRAERLKKFLATILDGESYMSARNKITWRKSESVSVVDVSILPADYMRETHTWEPDKTAIKDAIKKGKTIPGAELLENNNIQIK